MSEHEPALFEVRDLVKTWRVPGGLFAPRRVLRAVDHVSFAVARRETLALVGESGSGKTTAARAALRLVEPDGGRVLYRADPGSPPVDLRALSRAGMRRVRRDLQIVFQDPWASLNPRLLVREIVGEALHVHRIARGIELDRRVAGLLERVGLAAETGARFPHELSGGMRQRVGIARALALEPRFLVCDEPVGALDVSLQAQILNLFADLQDDLGIAYLFIAHDLAVVRHLADRVAVMYLGRIVEEGTVAEIFERAAHPYTQALLAAIPRIGARADGDRSRARAIEAFVAPAPARGCPYQPRCPLAEARCAEREPPRVRLSATHAVVCHLADPAPQAS